MDDKIIQFPDQYTAEDFLDSTKPYEEVYRYKDDPFRLNQEIAKMADVASKVGVKNFKTLFTGYLKSQRAIKQVTSNISAFTGKDFQLSTGDWLADDTGITRIGPFGEIEACAHPIYPAERLVNVDTGMERVTLVYKKGGRWLSKTVDKGIIASANQIVSLASYGVAVTSESAKYLVQWLHDAEYLNYERIPEYRSVSRLGWIGDEFSPYVEHLVFDGDQSFQGFFDAVGPHGNRDEWMALASYIRQGSNIAPRIMLAASFASVLVKPCGGLPFFVHLWGGTETGKTVGLMLAVSVYADPTMGRYIHTFNSTAVAQELSAGFTNSMPLALDELQVIKDRKNFDQIIYQLAEGVGRARGQKSGGLQRTNTWQNCILTTGEQPISSAHSGGGAVNRIVEINCEDTKLFDDPAEVCDIIKDNYGFAGKEFVEWLMSPGNIEEAKSVQREFYLELSRSGATEKQALAASMILAADKLTDEALFHDGSCLTVDDIKPFLLSHKEVSQNERAYEWLLGWIAQYSENLKDEAREKYGKVDDNGNIRIIAEVFNNACINAGFNPRGFMSWMKRNDKIQTSSKGFTMRSYINKKLQTQCVVLKSEDFTEIEEGSHTYEKFD